MLLKDFVNTYMDNSSMYNISLFSGKEGNWLCVTGFKSEILDMYGDSIVYKWRVDDSLVYVYI